MKLRIEVGPMNWVENVVADSHEDVLQMLERRYRLRASDITEVKSEELPIDARVGWSWPGVRVLALTGVDDVKSTSPDIAGYQRDMVVRLRQLDRMWATGDPQYESELSKFHRDFGGE